MLASAAVPYSAHGLAATAMRGGGCAGGYGDALVLVPLCVGTAFVCFVAFQLFGVEAAAIVMVLFCAFSLAAQNLKVTRGFPFLRLSLGWEDRGVDGGGGNGGGGGGGVGPAASGMDAATTMALPAAFGYKRDDAAAGWAQCSICISVVDVGESVRRLPSCGHLFHAGCIDKWLGAHATCPLCRAAVPELPV
ncbi:hypothetical protein GUJ93_ZPchr0012g18991 [Zizania palustris]|uniref:RING-type E3 ubiquitin transferase n=1 Tax=Zizania palustris TaxID=103762 RepID=A0A8J5WLU8_ZIZPA|nr:hypothetical protein GUJ93_ZPchr0012g18991 [Zizania palustris]